MGVLVVALTILPQTVGSGLPLCHPRRALQAPTNGLSVDRILVQDAIDGDQRAWRELYLRYSKAVHGCILAKVPVSDAEDLVQDVFMLALSKLASLEDHGRFGGWLLTIARNRRHDYWRRHQPSEEISDDHKQVEQPPSLAAARALQAIRALPDSYQESLIMRLVEGMTGPEIADRLGLSHGSVRVNLSRGMKLLREALDDKESA